MQYCKLDNRAILKCTHLLSSFECGAASYPPELRGAVDDLQRFWWFLKRRAWCNVEVSNCIIDETPYMSGILPWMENVLTVQTVTDSNRPEIPSEITEIKLLMNFVEVLIFGLRLACKVKCWMPVHTESLQLRKQWIIWCWKQLPIRTHGVSSNFFHVGIV